jgi:hypothetical protein
MADSIAGAVASALAQEMVSRAVSLVLQVGLKREDKAPAPAQLQAQAAGAAGHNAERLKMAVSQLEFALERTGKLPITDVSLLDQRKMFKLAFIEGTSLLITEQRLRRQSTQARHQHEEVEEEANHQKGQAKPKRRRRWVLAAMARPFLTSSSSSPSSSSPCIDAAVVRRFEWMANCAGRFVRDVAESGSSLRHCTFCNPVVRRLLEGKHLRYEAEQGAVLRFLDLWPLCVEGRGVETILEYGYEDRGAPEKNLLLHIVLRLSESMDVFGTAIRCLQAMASQLKLLVSEAAVGELALLAASVDMCRSSAPPWARIDEGEYARASQAFRRDPVCCRDRERGQQLGRPRATSGGGVADAASSPELSRILPEQIIVLAFWCRVPAAPGCGLLPTRPPLKMTVFFSPHACCHDAEEERRSSWALDLSAGENGNPLLRDVSVQQVAEMVGPKALDRFLRQPHLAVYAITWGSEHGKAIFILERPKEQDHRRRTERNANRRHMKEGQLQVVR